MQPRNKRSRDHHACGDKDDCPNDDSYTVHDWDAAKSRRVICGPGLEFKKPGFPGFTKFDRLLNFSLLFSFLDRRIRNRMAALHLLADFSRDSPDLFVAGMLLGQCHTLFEQRPCYRVV